MRLFILTIVTFTATCIAEHPVDHAIQQVEEARHSVEVAEKRLRSVISDYADEELKKASLLALEKNKKNWDAHIYSVSGLKSSLALLTGLPDTSTSYGLMGHWTEVSIRKQQAKLYLEYAEWLEKNK